MLSAWKRRLSALLLFTILTGPAHTLIHASEDHLHDESCAVYVLEQLYLAQTEPAPPLIFTLSFLFLPFIYPRLALFEKRSRTESIRAPPAY